MAVYTTTVGNQLRGNDRVICEPIVGEAIRESKLCINIDVRCEWCMTLWKRK
jgi:hypothetical protein